MSGETNICPEGPRRKALKVAASCLCLEAGFMSADEAALETLVEMMQSCEYHLVNGGGGW